jgi:hypothetical protein
MQPRNEKFFTLSIKAGSKLEESAANLMEFVAAPHERWAELAKHMLDTEHAGDETTQVVEENSEEILRRLRQGGRPVRERVADGADPPATDPAHGGSQGSLTDLFTA